MNKIYIITILIVILILLNLYNFFGKSNIISIKVNATPITNKTIILDAGHGLPDEGATTENSATEQEIALNITLKLQKLIEQSGGKVILTRADENGIYSLDSNSLREKKVSDIKNRVKLGNESDANIYLSIHLNKYPPSEIYKGWQTFYQGSNEYSKQLATIIQNNLTKNIDIANNRVPHIIQDVYIMKHIQIPTVIVECGFLSNIEETKLLNTEKYQNTIAWGIYTGVQGYFNDLNNMKEVEVYN